MTYPLVINKVTVTEQFFSPITGEPDKGTVYITAQQDVISSDDTTYLAGGERRGFTLDPLGLFETELSCADPDFGSIPFLYKVEVELSPGKRGPEPFFINLTADMTGTTVTLLDLEQVEPGPVMTQYLQITGGTLTGDLEVGADLDVTGETTLAHVAATGVNVNGNVAVTGTTAVHDLNVSGTLTSSGAFAPANVTTGDVVANTASVTGNHTLGAGKAGIDQASNKLRVTSDLADSTIQLHSTAASVDSVIGTTTVTSVTSAGLAVTGTATVSGNESVLGNLSVTGTTNSTGAATFGGNVHVLGNLTVDGTGGGGGGGGGATVSQVRTALDPYNVQNYGAVLDAKRRAGVVATSTSATAVTVPGAGFTSGDVGKLFMGFSPTNWGTVRTIATVTDATHIVLSGAVGVTLGGTDTDCAVWGTDDAAAFQAAINAAGTAAAGKLLNGGENLPISSGHPTVVVDNMNEGGFLVRGASLQFPSGVGFESTGTMAYNLITDRTAPLMTFAKGNLVPYLRACLLNGGGITVGTSATQCHSVLGRVELWNPGPNVAALALLGYHHEVGVLIVKNGDNTSIGIDHTNSTDDYIGEAYFIGSGLGARIANANNIKYGHARGDTTTRGPVLQIDASTNVEAEVHDFLTTVSTQPYAVQIGSVSSSTSQGLLIRIQANRSGGKLLQIANCTQSKFEMFGSNADPLSLGGPITQGVEYGSGNVAPLFIEQYLPPSVTASTGTVVGELVTHTASGQAYGGSFSATGLSVSGNTTLNNLTVTGTLTGAPGPSTLVDVGTWAASTTYPAGTVLTYAGQRYITWQGAAAQTIFTNTNWVALGAAPDTF